MALIVEDERVAVLHLERQLAAVDPDVVVAGVLQSVEECVEWFESHTGEELPDVVFMDIHLADGLAFRIFDQTEVQCPVVFTTAYDEYALKAFEVNGVDYLLKPIGTEDLRRALGRIAQRRPPQREGDEALRRTMDALAGHYRQYKRFFLIPRRDRLVPIEVAAMACVVLDEGTEHHGPVALMLDGASHPLPGTLDSVMEQLDPAQFFRVNRQCIVAHRAICEIAVWMLGKYTLRLAVATPQRIVVPKARVAEFKEWYMMGGGAQQ